MTQMNETQTLRIQVKTDFSAVKKTSDKTGSLTARKSRFQLMLCNREEEASEIKATNAGHNQTS